MAFLVPALMMNMTTILLSNVTSSIYNINAYIITNKNQSSLKMATFVREYDIIHKIRTIAQFIESIHINSNMVQQQIESIHQCIDEITKQLKIIEERLIYNKSIWIMTTVRSYGFDNRIKELEILMKVLSERFNLLVITYKSCNDCNNYDNDNNNNNKDLL